MTKQNANEVIDQAYSTKLAKLMATENLDVVFGNVTKASFDIRKRKLVLPNYNISDKDILDLMISSEISHAVYDDQKKFTEFAENYQVKDKTGKKILDPRMQAIYNIVSSARSEKLIKRKFPGLKPTYARAYKKLAKEDWFGVNDIPEQHLYETLSLADRLNLHFKAGHHYSVPFDYSEKPLVDRLENIETMDDVLEIAKHLYEDTVPPPPMGGSGDGEPDENQSDSGDNQGKGKGKGKPSKSKSKPQQASGQSSNNDSTDEDAEDFANNKGRYSNESDGDDSDSDGDMIPDFMESSAQFSEQETTGKVKQAQVGSTQGKFENMSQKAIKPAGTVTNFHMNFEMDTWKDNFVPFNVFSQEYSHMNEFGNRIIKAKPIVNYMFKQFETKRRAHEFRKVLPSKRGGIDPNKMYRYSFDDEIFRRKTMIQDSKNHGLVILIDFSGSMSGSIGDCILMTLDLIQFCQKAGIKYEVLGFTDSYVTANGKQHVKTRPEGARQNTSYYFNGGYSLVQLLSSSMNRKQLVSAANWLANLDSRNSGMSNLKNKIALGGTPLNDALVQMPSFINAFRKRHNIEIVNFITLSDGDSNALLMATDGGNVYGYTSGARGHFGGNSITITDTASKITLKRDNCYSYSPTEMILKMIKQTANVKTACFYIAGDRSDLATRGKQIITQRDNGKIDKIPNTTSFRNAMGYDLMTFLSPSSIQNATLSDIEKNLKAFIEVIS